MGKHVVLVEDELNIAEAIRFLLSNEGWRVETIANGASAYEIIRKAEPDLVMLDVMLPGLDLWWPPGATMQGKAAMM